MRSLGSSPGTRQFAGASPRSSYWRIVLAAWLRSSPLQRPRLRQLSWLRLQMQSDQSARALHTFTPIPMKPLAIPALVWPATAIPTAPWIAREAFAQAWKADWRLCRMGDT